MQFFLYSSEDNHLPHQIYLMSSVLLEQRNAKGAFCLQGNIFHNKLTSSAPSPKHNKTSHPFWSRFVFFIYKTPTYRFTTHTVSLLHTDKGRNEEKQTSRFLN